MIIVMLAVLKFIIPESLVHYFRAPYHYSLSLVGAILHGFPARKLVVIGITGTKGKSSTAEILGNILEEAGCSTAILGTIRFKIGKSNERNIKKMTMPGRFFVQKFLASAVRAKCTHAIIEMTSEGAKQYRERFVDMNALIFTNLAPEHIESHGSYEKYRDAKLAIAQTLSRSTKPHRYMIANKDDGESSYFLEIGGTTPVPFSITDGEPLVANDTHIELTFRGRLIRSVLIGRFNAYNILAAAVTAEKFGASLDAIVRGIETIKHIDGRMEQVEAGQDFPIFVDYAHTPDSLEAVYQTFSKHQIVGVLGNTGGGRDTWKRPIMGAIADKYCRHIILTNEDPYDENPEGIVNAMLGGIQNKETEVILDRRAAIARALQLGKDTENSVVLITGKGTDPYIMGPNGAKTPWDDRAVAREEIEKILGT